MPEESNALTIKAYNQNVSNYIQHTPSVYSKKHIPLLSWINASLSFCTPNGKILEIGSATNRDANYMRSKGFSVQCSDGTEKFVDHLKELGEDALLINAVTDEIPSGYDMIFANAVVPHFSPGELRAFVEKTYTALNKNGILSFSAKQGEGEKWINEKFNDKRFINYWDPNELIKLVESCGFKVVYKLLGTPGDLPSHIWANLVFKKLS